MRGLYHSVSSHVHSMEDLGERELTSGWFCQVGVVTEAEHVLLKSGCGEKNKIMMWNLFKIQRAH